MKNMMLILMLVIMTKVTFADLVEVDDLYLETEKMVKTNRNYHLPKTSEPKYNFNLGLNMTDGLNIFYSNNKISSTVDQSQFRYVALDTEFGIRTTLGMRIYFRHFSGHQLDSFNEESRFPEENVVGLRFSIIGD